MIKSEVQPSRAIAIGVMPVYPTPDVVAAIATAPEEGSDQPQVKSTLLVQVQILDYPSQEVRESIVMDRNQFLHFLRSALCVSKSFDGMEAAIDAEFADYRDAIVRNARKREGKQE